MKKQNNRNQNKSCPETLADLSTYLGMTGFLRNYIPFYSAKAQALQERKTFLTNLGPAKGKLRKAYSGKAILIDPTENEKEAFVVIQSHFRPPTTMLMHHNPKGFTFMDVDS